MNILKTLAVTPLLVLLAAPAMAHPKHADNGVRERIERQEMRIKQGVRSGQLTRHEAKRLKHNQRDVSLLYKQLRRDGRLDRLDRKLLRRELDRNGKLIKRLKHNQREAYRNRSKHHRDDYYAYERNFQWRYR
jgi:hypothetical protein